MRGLVGKKGEKEKRCDQGESTQGKGVRSGARLLFCCISVVYFPLCFSLYAHLTWMTVLK